MATLELEVHATREVDLEGVDFPLVLVQHVFPTEDGSVDIRYLASSDTPLSCDDLPTTSHDRWPGECYHKSLKQHVSLAKSPTQTLTTPTNPFFAALCGLLKLERLKLGTKLHHFALKSKLYLNALRSAFSTFPTLTPVQDSA